jgi:hypothetical protein
MVQDVAHRINRLTAGSNPSKTTPQYPFATVLNASKRARATLLYSVPAMPIPSPVTHVDTTVSHAGYSPSPRRCSAAT